MDYPGGAAVTGWKSPWTVAEHRRADATFISGGLPKHYDETFMALLEYCQWLQETAISISIRESILAFPVIEGLHLLGISVSAGLIAISDLRMMGMVLKKESASDVFHQLIPWISAGFALMIITGSLLFLSEPVKCYTNLSFRFKVLFLFIAGINILIFHSSTIYRKMNEWEWAEDPPRAAKVAGWVSLISWGIVIIVGRTTAYNF